MELATFLKTRPHQVKTVLKFAADLPPSMIPLPMLVRHASAARSAAGGVESLGHVAQPAARAENARASGAGGR